MCSIRAASAADATTSRHLSCCVLTARRVENSEKWCVLFYLFMFKTKQRQQLFFQKVAMPVQQNRWLYFEIYAATSFSNFMFPDWNYVQFSNQFLILYSWVRSFFFFFLILILCKTSRSSADGADWCREVYSMKQYWLSNTALWILLFWSNSLILQPAVTLSGMFDAMGRCCEVALNSGLSSSVKPHTEDKKWQSTELITPV